MASMETSMHPDIKGEPYEVTAHDKMPAALWINIRCGTEGMTLFFRSREQMQAFSAAVALAVGQLGGSSES